MVTIVVVELKEALGTHVNRCVRGRLKVATPCVRGGVLYRTVVRSTSFSCTVLLLYPVPFGVCPVALRGFEMSLASTPSCAAGVAELS